MPSESDRQQAQESRRQALAQEHADALSSEDNPALPQEYLDALAEADEPQTAQVLVGAQVTDGGIAVEILIPWESIGFDASAALRPEVDGPEA